MRLFEEYFKRHNIQDVPLVHHCDRGALILESLEDKIKILIFIEWKDFDVHPGQYVIQSAVPIHNGYRKGEFFNIINCVKRDWHEYESYFIELVKEFPADKIRVIKDEKEVLLICWEIFVHVNDEWFARMPGYAVRESLFESVNKDNSFEVRYQQYQNVYHYLLNNFSLKLDDWKNKMVNKIVNPYSQWLVDLHLKSLKG